MTEAQQKIMDYLKQDRFVSANGISIMTGLPLDAVIDALDKLEKEHKIKFLPFKNGGEQEDKAYYLPR